MDAFQYASYVRGCAKELYEELGVVPVYARATVLPEERITSEFYEKFARNQSVFCHPEDKEIDNVYNYKHPWREL